ncbi:hypothetical protein [Stenotrophomonas sp.]|uniref:hypothetical protein n=1 Tax=Stenotrophomonas sp. TaxID=69392 RepID=UPI0028A891B2|nr:hypothetical protein [Stenotrophomonas sp.]
MAIPGISHVLNVLRAQDVQKELKTAPDAEARCPVEVVSGLRGMLQEIRNGQSAGVGISGGNGVAAYAEINAFVERAPDGESVPLSAEGFASMLLHVSQLEEDLARQLKNARSAPAREALQRAIGAAENVKHLSR